MIGRRQLPVASPISIAAVLRALVAASRGDPALPTRARQLVEREFGASSAALTDSGTSALVLALRHVVPPGGVVGFPAFACVDLAAAARQAGVQVRLYDLDPTTLGPDLDSIHAMVRRGVDAVVVAHLFGYPADVAGIRAIVARHGIPVIEDAAQGARGSLGGRRLGTLGDVVVLSFGRGKGLCAGGGGALLAFDPRWTDAVESSAATTDARGWSNLAKTAVQWALGRPSVYALPATVPWLRLGEMVYHPAHEPTALAITSCALLHSAFDLEAADVAGRRARAQAYETVARQTPALAVPRVLPDGVSGYLRYVVRDLAASRAPDAALGIVRPYPRALIEQLELRPVLVADEPPTPGAIELRKTVLTLPTHRFVNDADVARILQWMRRDYVGSSPP